MLKVLEVVSALGCGGVERLLLNYLKELHSEEIIIDIVTFDNGKELLTEQFKALGCNIFNVTRMRANAGKMFSELNSIIRNGGYDVVHCHQGYLSLPAISIAKKYNVPVRIAHSHFAFIPESTKKRIFRKLVTALVKKRATKLYGCGTDAAKWAWGAKIVESNNVKIMNNAINIDNFKFDENARNEIRNEMGLENKYVIGNVARFSYQKNHEFLLRSFQKVYEKDKNTVLMLIGDGELMKQTKEIIDSFGIKDAVLLLGAREDVSRLLNAMDLFVLPSRFEGLPVTIVEAQCNGLPCCISDNITREVKVSENAVYLSIDKNAEQLWTKAILNKPNRCEPEQAVKNIIKAGYDIKNEAYKLLQEYEKSKLIV